MPELTPKLKIPKPLGNEYHNRANYNAVIDSLENAAGTPGGLAMLDDTGKVIGVPDVKDASTTQKGIVQLDDSTSSSSTTQAATANAARKAKGEAISWAQGFGLGANAKVATGDWNTHILTGFYMGQGLLNQPTKTGANEWKYVISIQHHATLWAVQIAIDFNGVGQWIRNFKNGTWEPWRELETTSGAQTKADSAREAAINWAKGFGFGTNVKQVSIDLNTLSETGFYYAQTSATNKPGNNNAWIIHQNFDASFATQLGFDLSKRVWIRQKISGIWNAWVRLIDESMKNQPNGYAGLDGTGKLLDSVLPSTASKSATISYTGNGASSRDIIFGFKPKLIFMSSANNARTIILNEGGYLYTTGTSGNFHIAQNARENNYSFIDNGVNVMNVGLLNDLNFPYTATAIG